MDKWSRYFSVQRMVTHLNNVEAEKNRRRRLQEQKEAEEAAAVAALEAKAAAKADPDGGKKSKKRFSLIEASLFSARTRSSDTESVQQKGKRRWSLRPAFSGRKASKSPEAGPKAPHSLASRAGGPSAEHYELKECSESVADSEEAAEGPSSPQPAGVVVVQPVYWWLCTLHTRYTSSALGST